MAEENIQSNNCCQCECDCECCKSEKFAAQEKKSAHVNEINWHLRATDTVGSSFLGILAILLLVFLVRSNMRNRELLLEVIQLRRQ